MARSNDSYVPVTFHQVGSSAKALKVTILTPRKFHAACWLPKSQLGTVSTVSAHATNVEHDVYAASLPKWLYDSKFDEDIAAEKASLRKPADPDEVNRKLADATDYRPRQWGDNADTF